MPHQKSFNSYGEGVKALPTGPKFSAGAIAWYKKPSASKTPTFEIDCKVLSSYSDGYTYIYAIVTADGLRFDVYEKELISKEELESKKAKMMVVLKEPTYGITTEDQFFLIDGWFVTEKFGIHIEEKYFNEKLKHLFNVVPRTNLQGHKW